MARVPGPRDYAELEVILGYTFRDRSLLEQALRHASWCNEQGQAREPGATRAGDNQRLEFLGDAVLSLTVSQRLMFRFPDAHEGDLSVTRAQVVSEEGLSGVALALGFGDWLMLGKGEEKSGGRGKPKILADAFEAIVAAVYLDGGFQAANDLVERLLTDRINAAEIKTYRVVQELGPDHDKRFVVAVTIGSEEWARAVGKSKKEAEQMAAAEAHFKLEGSDVGIRPKR
jgi:dsRNA-specific ribonuclease